MKVICLRDFDTTMDEIKYHFREYTCTLKVNDTAAEIQGEKLLNKKKEIADLSQSKKIERMARKRETVLLHE